MLDVEASKDKCICIFGDWENLNSIKNREDEENDQYRKKE